VCKRYAVTNNGRANAALSRPSFRGAQSANLRCAVHIGESRGSGSSPSDHPGTTDKKLKGSVIVADGVRKDEEFSGTKEVEERHRINEANLDGWMREHVEGYRGALKVLQFKGGQSNPTYKIETPD